MDATPRASRFAGWFTRNNTQKDCREETKATHPKWSMGIMNDPWTTEVPGTVLLLTNEEDQSLDLRQIQSRASRVSVQPGVFAEPDFTSDGKKTAQGGKIILEPQPEDSPNDPLNWPKWRRDMALLSLGFYCMVGGGIGPLLAAGYYNIADQYGVPVQDISLTTGLYMMGLGLGSVVASPMAILWGKRPVYLASAIIFIGSSVWCAMSPSFTSLVVARVVQGMAISPVECLPSATISEIFFLHERAYRIGIYTLMLLSGKNLVPLISAAIIQGMSWPWVFWIFTMVGGFCFAILFVFLPESFWERKTPQECNAPTTPQDLEFEIIEGRANPETPTTEIPSPNFSAQEEATDDAADKANKKNKTGPTPALPIISSAGPSRRVSLSSAHGPFSKTDDEELAIPASALPTETKPLGYSDALRDQPAKPFVQQLKVWNGRLKHDSFLKAMIRPLILLAYPSVLWSTVIYSCSVGWLLLISNTMSMIFRTKDGYNFTVFQTGLLYISPFIGGILGTAIAGKVSDVVVKAMARRNGGVYEPEFRLIMAAPILFTTVIGLMGFGWSAQVGNHFMIPTVFFGIISFGCSLGSTTSITFCVDSYSQYAGEALVTLNFCKNIFHGLAFSLFVTHWMSSAGPKTVYIWLGIIQLIMCLFSIPMYIYGKRLRMWTVRMNFMERF
ncbi:MFS1 family protein [Plectosphaerella plurivora]|uniref:MFS1 family protein n=1 Tax=Plectosphaerella plurivora TaxID=936078 RepID=A0A9P8V7K8_9PEZI|nr:MFS1 family protein [Plectosphaerella plurivora]